MKTHREEIANCPFCGGEAGTTKAVGEWWVRCLTCEASTVMAGSEERAIAAWNRRADPLVEELRGSARELAPAITDASVSCDADHADDAERARFEDWAIADHRCVHPLEDEERTPDNGLYYAEDSTNHAYIGWRERAAREALALPVGEKGDSARDLAPQPVSHPEPAANADGAVRAAFRAGWYANAAVEDQPADYLAGCEEVDWRDYLSALSSEVPPVGSERSDEGKEAPADPLGAGWQTIDVLPDVGRKFIALYDDGSGAAMFWRHDDGFIDQNGDEFETVGKGYDRWAYLPDELEFWCETVAEDPVILTLPPAALAQPSPLDTSGRVEGSSVAESAASVASDLTAGDAQCQSEGGGDE